MDRDKQIELYREFLLKCTRNPNSANNYSDFKRINECLTLLFPNRGDLSILDFDDPEEFNSVVERLNKLQQYIDYNQKGKNQYSNAVAFYQCYLNAKKLFIDARKEKKANKGICSRALQQIFYGAPGTGKSHIIKEQTKGEDVIRTTFHPDTDYSTFVGTYKPTTEFAPVLAVIGDKAVETGREEKRISYEFVCQAFLQAYVAAWEKVAEAKGGMPKKQFLVIEEINRGNCAQIFGDLFQLLDRNDYGYSDYPIQADADMQKQLKRLFGGVDIENAESINSLYDGRDIVQEVLSGEVLLLPNNLHIWATMNTSDQSLFPIDSAFKRRWEWVYMPIADAKKNYVIEIDNDQYDWWSFLEAINAIIESTTHSEDKKLGYFFAKAKNGRISVETFVSKVIFYLWNDVFKDNETNHKAFKDSDGELLPFRKFFHHDGTVDTNMVIKFLQDLEVFPFEHSDDGTTAVSDTTPNTKRQRDKSRYRVNGTDNLNKAQMTREAFRLYIEAHPDADAQTIAQAWNGLGLKDYVQHLVETEAEYNARTKDSTDSNKRATEFELSNGEKIYLSTQFGIGNIGKFMDAVNNAGWNIRIENQD
ncbi:MAG: AAA family ATPase [Prevotella sp.]|nr:AAA family ATPase [Prevotella sp.]